MRPTPTLLRDDVAEPKPGPLTTEVGLVGAYLFLLAEQQLEGEAAWQGLLAVAVGVLARWGTKARRAELAVVEARERIAQLRVTARGATGRRSAAHIRDCGQPVENADSSS